MKDFYCHNNCVFGCNTLEGLFNHTELCNKEKRNKRVFIRIKRNILRFLTFGGGKETANFFNPVVK